MMLNLTAPCHFGLEKTLSFEIKRAGGENVRSTDGRVNFTGDESVLVRANIGCSVAERIGLVIAEFDSLTFDDVFDNLKKAPISQFIGKNDKFPIVKGQSVNSKLTSIPALQRTVKKALVTAMSEQYKTSVLPETGVDFPVRFFLHKDRLTVYIDSSGEGLHKRGYRAKSNAAPIKETLASGLIDLAHIRETDTVIDPFCGSGTILIESVFKALNIAPGLNRAFTSMKWDFIPKDLWNDEIRNFRAKIKPKSDFHAFGFDIDNEAIALCKENALKAGVHEYITFEKRAIKDFKYPVPAKKYKVITNPPYAERLLEISEAEEIYRTMGRTLLPRNQNEIYVITSNEDFEKLFGEKAAKNRKLYNGMLMCRYYMYNTNPL